ncbi:soluble lytic murein transglycosylase [Gammaproteobacteria bacterium]
MLSHRFRWCVSVVVFSGVLSSSVAVAGSRDGIRMWRDRNGVLNITNVHSSDRVLTYVEKARVPLPAKSSTVVPVVARPPVPSVAEVAKAVGPSTPVPQSSVVPPVSSPPIASRPSLSAAYTSIYSYVDKVGIRHFTNVRTGDQRYELALRTISSRPSLMPGPLLTLTARQSAYDSIVAEAAQAYQVDQALVRAMIHTESAFNPMAVSRKGAAGLMQLMPDTAHRYGVRDAFDPTENVYGGVRYLRDLLDMFGNNLPLAVAAYNAGENAVTRYGGIPPYAETTGYVQRVLSLHSSYQNKKNTTNN